MRKIVYYISDVGWGHTTRSVALIRKLLAELDSLKVVVRNRSALPLLKLELSGTGVEIVENPHSLEPMWPRSYPFEKKEVREQLEAWMDSWENYVEEEKNFLKKEKPTLVISDISPVPFEAAHELSIPCVAVSNLNWWDEYLFILDDEELLVPIKEAYHKATWCFLLPLESENRAFRLIERVPLLAREIPSEKVRDIRRNLRRTYQPEIIATVNTGTFYEAKRNLLKAIEEASRRAKILWIARKGTRMPESALVHYIGPDEPFHCYIAASDFIVSKYGYGTVSEAVLSMVPMLLLYRPEVLEDSLATEELVQSGWALRVSMAETFKIPLEELFQLSRSPLSKRMRNEGAEHIVKRLMEKFL